MRLRRYIVPLALVAALSATAAAAAGAQRTSAKVTTITFWHAYATNPASPELQQLTKVVIPRFEKLNPTIKVNQVPFDYNDLSQKLTTSAAGGTLPDVIRSDIAWVPQYAKLGVFAPLDKLMRDFKRLAKATYAGSLATNFYKGHYYGLPLDTNTRVQMYNMTALNAAGISSPPKTFAQFQADAAALKAKGIVGFADSGTGGWNILPWIWSGGGNLTNATYTKATGYLNSPKSVAAVQMLVNMYKAGEIPDLITGNQGALGTEDGLAQGKYATILDGPWMFPIFHQAYPGFRLQTSLVPAGPGGSVSVVGGEDIVVTQQSNNKAAAEQFVRFMLSPWAQLQMAHAGQMPVRPDVTKQLTKLIPYYSIFVTQLKTARPRTPSPQWPQIDNVLGNAVSSAFKGQPVQQALDSAAKQIDALLAG